MGRRLLRVNESVKEVVSAVIAEGLKDPRVGFVTVTGVETSADLRHARVFVSVLGGERARSDTLAGLEASRGYLQARVNDALHMKRTPHLVFVYDATTDTAMRIEGLLRREAEVLGERPAEAAVDGGPEEPGGPDAAKTERGRGGGPDERDAGAARDRDRFADLGLGEDDA